MSSTPLSLHTVLQRTVCVISSGKSEAGKTTVMAALVDHIAQDLPGAPLFILDTDLASTLPLAFGLDTKPEVGIG